MSTDPADQQTPASPSEKDAPRSSPPSEEETPPAPSSEAVPGEGVPGEDIPLQGTHQGDTDAPLTSSVHAQPPPDPRPAPEPAADDDPSGGDPSGGDPSGDLGTYQLSRDPESGRHRVRVRPPEGEAEALGGGFEELSRHSSPGEMSDALDGTLEDGPRFVVLENTDTGDTFFDREGELSDRWFAGGRFDQVTLFDSEDEAAAYADERQNQGEQG